jgi:predicted nucleic acid-binding protein
VRAFLDSNILIYTIDPRDPHKRDGAIALVTSLLDSSTGVVSTQSLQEFAVNALGKMRIPPHAVKQSLRGFERLAVVSIRPAIIDDAIDLHVGNQFHFYDALIIASALAANCDCIYTEDLSHGQIIRNLRIVNPFKGL